VKRSDEQVEHHRVLRSGNEKGAVEFMFVGAEKASIPCAESLDALLKAARTALGLR
jgi:capsid protein